MAKSVVNFSGLITFFGILLVTTPLTRAPAQTGNSRKMPSHRQMIHRRLISDMQELKSQINELREQIQQIQGQMDQLRRESRKQESEIQRMKVRHRNHVNKTESRKQSSATKNQQSKTRSSKKMKGDTPVIYAGKEREEGVWVEEPGRPYSIRRSVLDHEIIYVTDDDTILSTLAHKYYHNASYYRKIYKLNRDRLPSPDVVPPGVRLRLPPIGQLPDD